MMICPVTAPLSVELETFPVRVSLKEVVAFDVTVNVGVALYVVVTVSAIVGVPLTSV
jgi:hypothetical protein